jgi:hypothetical protein
VPEEFPTKVSTLSFPLHLYHMHFNIGYPGDISRSTGLHAFIGPSLRAIRWLIP